MCCIPFALKEKYITVLNSLVEKKCFFSISECNQQTVDRQAEESLLTMVFFVFCRSAVQTSMLCYTNLLPRQCSRQLQLEYKAFVFHQPPHLSGFILFLQAVDMFLPVSVLLFGLGRTCIRLNRWLKAVRGRP